MAVRRHRSKVHPGVSIKELRGGVHRLRWREREADGTHCSQSWTVHCSPADAERWALHIYESLQRDGTFLRPEHGGAQPNPARPEVSDLRLILHGWIAWRAQMRRMAPSTVDLYHSGIRTLQWHLRALSGVPDPEPIPSSMLSVDLCTDLLQRLTEIETPCGRGEGQTRPCGPTRRRALLGYLYEAWVWASDEPERWPGVPSPPRMRSKVVPRSAPKKRPPPAPTWAEMDAVIRHAGPGNTQDVLVIQRCTGLRQGQVCQLRVRDVLGLDGPTPSLEITTGKSRQEQRGREVPVAPALVPLLHRLTDGKPDDAYLVGTRALTASALADIYRSAEAAGELRPAVWRSERRTNKRTSHGMRAGFQRGLRRADVEDRVIDALVGHVGRTTRDQHYDDADWEELVEAVRRVPEVEWGGEGDGR